jgi:hypothetical protein
MRHHNFGRAVNLEDGGTTISEEQQTLKMEAPQFGRTINPEDRGGVVSHLRRQ